MSDELAKFLRDRLDDDEAIATAAAHGEDGHWTTEGTYPVSVADELAEGADVFERVVTFDEGSPSEEQAAHIARYDPARVLAEVVAKRRIVFLAERLPKLTASTDLFDNNRDAWAEVLKQLALPYVAHPGYREEWRP